jgi:hypothetical protein
LKKSDSAIPISNKNALQPSKIEKFDLTACTQPKVVGKCKAAMFRTYYNAETQKCEDFIYGGCDGNINTINHIFKNSFVLLIA